MAFDFTKSEQYILSIRLSTDGFSFSIFNPEGEKDFIITPYPVNNNYSMTANVKELFASDETFKRRYKQVNVLVDTPRFMTLPLDMFDDEQMETLFYSAFTKQDNEIVLCNVLAKNDIVALFAMDKHTHQLINEQYPLASYYATNSPLTDYFLTKGHNSTNKRLYAYTHHQVLDVCCLDNGKLQLTNSFKVPTPSDTLYYLLYIWKQMGMDAEGKDELFIAGQQNDSLIAELRKFIRNIYPIYPKAAFNRSTFAQENVPFDLQTLLICE